MQLNNEKMQSQELNQQNPQVKKTSLEEIRARVTGQSSKLSFDDAIFELWSLIGGFGDFVGREFYVVYQDDKIVKVIQKPIRTKVLLKLFKLFEKYCERQERSMKKNQPKTLGRR
mgnify:CR=1 FL=1